MVCKMYLIKNKKGFKNRRIFEISFLSGFILILLLIQIPNANLSSILKNEITNYQDFTTFNENLKIASDDSILFQGTEIPLNITDYGNLQENNQDISLNNEDVLNLTYYLDDEHDWKVSKIENSISNIQDTRNWVNNSDLLDVQIQREYSVYQTDHEYDFNNNWPQNLQTITETGAIAMRVHFNTFNFTENRDYVLIDNENNIESYYDTGQKTDFYSPWIEGEELNIYYESDNIDSGNEWGYYIDYYEYITPSSNYYANNYSWNLNEYIPFNTGGTGGFGEVDNSSAMYLRFFPYLEWDSSDDQYWAYYGKGEFVEMYQELNIPRGSVVDGYISFDYNAEYCMETNNLFIYVEINNQKIYSLGLFDIYEAGKNIWHSSGKIFMPLWVNTSNIFENVLANQELNISIGIKSGLTSWYGGFEDRFQQVIWFDNLTLGLTTIANSTQEGVNLTLNNKDLIYGNQWGKAFKDFTGNWDKNPITLTINTTSPSLNFKLNTTLYGYHNATSKINQQNEVGTSYKILENGTIYWEFLHNFYMPTQYSNFEFIIYKPLNWQIISANDQMGDSRPFEGGGIGDNTLKINKSNIFYGWWTFKAMSPNFLNISNTKIYNHGQWVPSSSYKTGESTEIKTQVNFSSEIPSNLELTSVYLTIYHPNGTIWIEESKSPDEYGNVTFSEITVGSYNTTGGIYNYTLFWSNGTALGGLKSSFTIIHESSMTLLRPTDAINDLIADGYVGDIIPLRIFLKDSENNIPISDAQVTHNWTGGQNIDLEDSAMGIYEVIVETETLSLGIYKIIINASKIGFLDCNLTLILNLGEDTKLQRLEYDYYIEFHANTSIKFEYLDSNDDGIDNAIVELNISNPSLYTINNTGNGIYNVEINTSFINKIGYFYLNINFSKGEYETQERTFQFEIVAQSVNLTVILNSQGIKENSLFESKFNDEIVIRANSMAKYDRIYLFDGNFTFICGDYEVNLTKSDDYWFNNSIKILTTYFSLGYNYAYIKFNMDNYQTTVFPFQIIISQIPIEVLTIDFDESVDGYLGEDISIEIQIKESGSNIFIDGATVSYSWDYGLGTLDGKGSGIYELELKIPDDIEEDNYKITLVISKEGSEYKSTEFSFIIDITKEEEQENPVLLWIILSILIGIIGILATLSYRSYVYLPRKRKKESELLDRTQKFKDLQNIQAIVFIHRAGGVPIYLKSYSILEHQKKELFSGFIQAITTIGEELSGKRTIIEEEEDLSKDEKILEIDFKHFYCLIADKGELRTIFILKDKSSDRLRKMVKEVSLDVYSRLKDQVQAWDGSLDDFEKDIPPILNEHFKLYYKEPFKLTKPQIIASIRKENELNSMEQRILNVLYSMLKGKSEFYLNIILEVVHEENKDLIIDSIESLLDKKILVPSYDGNYK